MGDCFGGYSSAYIFSKDSSIFPPAFFFALCSEKTSDQDGIQQINSTAKRKDVSDKIANSKLCLHTCRGQAKYQKPIGDSSHAK